MKAHQGTVSGSSPLWITASLVAQQKGLNTRFLSAPHSSQTLIGAIRSELACVAFQSLVCCSPLLDTRL